MSRQHIWLLRHGQSAWNATGRWQGHADPPLSLYGRAEAAAAATGVGDAVRASGRPVRVFSSDLRRALETATPILARLATLAEPTPELRELDLGWWSGLTRPEIEARDGRRLAAFDTGDPDVRPGGGESRRELELRACTCARALADSEPDADLLLVVHKGVIRALVPGYEAANLELVEAVL